MYIVRQHTIYTSTYIIHLSSDSTSASHLVNFLVLPTHKFIRRYYALKLHLRGTSWRSSGRLQSGLVLSLLKRAGDRGRKRGVCGNVVAGRDKWDSEESMGGCVEFHAWHVFIAASSRPHVSYSASRKHLAFQSHRACNPSSAVSCGMQLESGMEHTLLPQTICLSRSSAETCIKRVNVCSGGDISFHARKPGIYVTIINLSSAILCTRCVSGQRRSESSRYSLTPRLSSYSRV
jgi:hypothetical protein